MPAPLSPHPVESPAVPSSGAWAESVMAPIYAEGDRFSSYFILFHFVIGLGLAPFYDTWFMAVTIGALSAAMFLASAWLVPGTLLTRCIAGVSLQAFVALHIYQLHGLPEMHFFFFSAFTMLIAYQDWRAPWPGALLIIGQHIWFAALENSGVEMNFFEGPVTFWQLFFHFGIAILHVAVCSHWAMRLRRNTLREAWDQRRLDIALQKAETAAAAKSSFLATMSHEIRTPMNGVLGMMTLLEQTSLDDEQQEFLRIARRSGEGLLGVIDDVLDFSKLEAGRMQAERLAFSPVALLEDVHALLLPQAHEKQLEFAVETPAGLPPWLVGDSRRIRQILLNLVGNALKFTIEGSVRLIASADMDDTQGTLCITVQDSGIGMREDAVQRLFTEFTQADSTTTRRFGGTGLGLAISQRLAGLMGGAIAVESAVGIGTSFTLTLPVGTADQPDLRVPETHAAEPVGHAGLAVLLVEDNPVNQLVATRLLQKEGCTVDIAANGLEAVHHADRRAYDLVLMDCHMPVMDGFEATRRIRANEPLGSRLRIVALTASVLDSEREQCLVAGMDAVLAKPIARTALSDTITRVRAARGPEPPSDSTDSSADRDVA
jgi:signal transduction histidine kinase/ActR/RegA family two-component response regulator